jgi:hypothetical protein
MQNNSDYKDKKVKIFVKIYFIDSKYNTLILEKNMEVSNTNSSSHFFSNDIISVPNSLVIKFWFDENAAFKNFTVQENTNYGNPQIPDIVETYIKEQILMKENNDVDKIVNKGLNAVKNAFDRRFQQKLIEQAPKMLKCRYYYKGYTNIKMYSYYFTNETTNRSSDLQQSIVYLPPQTQQYYDVYLKQWTANRANVFDAALGHEMMAILDNNGNITANPQPNELFIYENEAYTPLNTLTTFDTDNLIDGSNITNNDKSYFTYLDNLKNSKEIMQIDLSKYQNITPVKTNNATVPVSHSTIYKLKKEESIQISESDKLNAVEVKIDSLSKEFVWGNPVWRNKYQTWCNVFAQYLSLYIYGKVEETSLVPITRKEVTSEKTTNKYYNANALFDYFSTSPHYISLKKNEDADIQVIWNYINKGYPVYFSWKNPDGGSGHIETGFPANTAINIWNRKTFEQENTDNSLDVNNKQLVVGAGSIVGFKSYERYKWLKNDETKAFLALQYLTNEY